MKYDLKGGQDQELRTNYALKAARCTWQVAYFTIATVWGYLVLKDTKWLPWWMLGSTDGGFEHMMT